MAVLFDGDGFCEVARLVNVEALSSGDVIGEELRDEVHEDGGEELEFCCNFYNIFHREGEIVGVGDDNDVAATSENFLDARDGFVVKGVVRK